jgi:hypothetical protein
MCCGGFVVHQRFWRRDAAVGVAVVALGAAAMS